MEIKPEVNDGEKGITHLRIEMGKVWSTARHGDAFELQTKQIKQSNSYCASAQKHARAARNRFAYLRYCVDVANCSD